MDKVKKESETKVILTKGSASVSIDHRGHLFLSITGNYAGMIIDKKDIGDFIMVVQALAEELGK